MSKSASKACGGGRLAAYLTEYRRALVAAAKAERLAGDLAKVAEIIKAEITGHSR